jgi:predicted ATPase
VTTQGSTMTNHVKSVTLLQGKFPTNKHYPFTLPIFNQTKNLFFDTPVTLFVGENGTGKSTLLEAMARACGIHIWSTSGGALSC